MTYPFQPKSTAKLQPGHFWPIVLDDGTFACGVVVDVVADSHVRILAGLTDWRGARPPEPANLETIRIAHQGVGHIKMIASSHGGITGILKTPPAPLLWTEHLRGKSWGLYQGLAMIDKIDSASAESYPPRTVWGYNVINKLANAQHAPCIAKPGSHKRGKA